MKDVPRWFAHFLDLLDGALRGAVMEGALLQSLWDLLINTWETQEWSVARSSEPTAARPSPGVAARSRPLPLGLQAFKDKGGQLVVEDLHGNPTTLGILDGKRFYFSKKGQFWDIARPPPTPCNACGEFHWAWECPQHSPPF